MVSTTIGASDTLVSAADRYFVLCTLVLARQHCIRQTSNDTEEEDCLLPTVISAPAPSKLFSLCRTKPSSTRALHSCYSHLLSLPFASISSMRSLTQCNTHDHTSLYSATQPSSELVQQLTIGEVSWLPLALRNELSATCASSMHRAPLPASSAAPAVHGRARGRRVLASRLVVDHKPTADKQRESRYCRAVSAAGQSVSARQSTQRNASLAATCVHCVALLCARLSASSSAQTALSSA